MSWKDIFPKENRYFETDNGILYCGDSLKFMEKFPKESVDLVLTDPPYNIKIDKWDNIDNYFEWFEKLCIKWKNLLKTDGSIYSFSGYQYGAELKIIFFKYFIYRNWIIWQRPGRGNYPNYTNSFEFIFFGSKTNKYNFFKLKEKSYLKGKYSFKNLKIYKDKYGWYRYRNLTNIWNVPSIVGNNPIKTKHKSQKPIELIEIPIKCSSKERNIVLDCFMGSGTTAVACEKLNRRWIGIEINPEYCEITKQRTLKAKVKGANNV